MNGSNKDNVGRKGERLMVVVREVDQYGWMMFNDTSKTRLVNENVVAMMMVIELISLGVWPSPEKEGEVGEE